MDWRNIFLWMPCRHLPELLSSIQLVQWPVPSAWYLYEIQSQTKVFHFSNYMELITLPVFLYNIYPPSFLQNSQHNTKTHQAMESFLSSKRTFKSANWNLMVHVKFWSLRDKKSLKCSLNLPVTKALKLWMTSYLTSTSINGCYQYC